MTPYERWKKAIDASDVGVCRQLIAEGVDVNASNSSFGIRPLWYLFSSEANGNIDIAKLLIGAGADIKAGNEGGPSALHFAARNGHSEGCRFLIGAGCDVNVQDNDGSTPLRDATILNRLEICRVLICCGADVHIATKKHDTALRYAARRNVVGICELLVQAGASPSWIPENPAKDYLTAFQSAVAFNQARVVRFFLEQCNVDIDERTVGGKTLFELVGTPGVLGLLLSKKTELAIRNALPDAPDGAAREPSRSHGMSPL